MPKYGMNGTFVSSRAPLSRALLRRITARAGRLALGVAFVVASATATAATAGSAEALRQAWRPAEASAAPSPVLAGGLRIESSQSADVLSGRLLGVLERPFAEVQAAVADPAGWCAVLILDPNIHACRPAAHTVEVSLGEAAAAVTFEFTRPIRGSAYAQSRLNAPDGPLGTRDYAIGLEATPLDPTRTLVQITFSQRFGWAARMAMAAYFTTAGRKKVGFTVVDRDDAGRPVYVGDLRGGIERNLARYFLAVEANAASRAVPPAQQPEVRVRTWLAGTERYPAQLREPPEYLERKVAEVRRQMTGE